MSKDDIRRHFEGIADEYDAWKKRSSYYYGLLGTLYRELVPEGASVLEIGCGTGTLLASLKPRRGVGVDLSARMVEIAAAKFPDLTFVAADAERLDLGETFDDIIVPDVIEHLTDVPAMLRSARQCCRPWSRVIVTSVNPAWAPILHLAERLGMKMPEGEHRWLSSGTLRRMALGAGFDVVSVRGRILFPKRIPGLSALLNGAAARLSFLRPLCLTQVLVLVSRAGATASGEGPALPGGTASPGSASPPREEREIAHRPAPK